MRDSGITMDIIPGNHDVYFKNTNELCSLKELLGYFTTNVNIVMKPTVLNYDGLKVAVLPWINNSNLEEYTKWAMQCDAPILGAHLELNGFELMRGVKNHHGMNPKIFKRFEMVLTGHFHCSSKQENVWYLGSQLEFFWSDAHDPKYFHIIDTETRQIEKIRNTYTLFEKVLYNDEEIDYNNYNKKFSKKFVKVVVVNKTDPFMFDRLIDNIQNQDIYELKIAENFNEFIGANVDDDDMNFEDTAEIVDTYIDAVDTDLDKDIIKVQMRELMTEAQALEIS